MSVMTRFMSCFVLLLIAVLTLVIVLVVSVINNLRGPSPPDVHAVARSKQVADAAMRVTKPLDDQLSALLRLRPWLHPQSGNAVDDRCTTVNWVEMRAVTCARTVTAFDAFDGDFVARNREIDARLVAAGWHAAPYGIPYVIESYYLTMQGQPQSLPPHPYGANDLPAASYTLLRADPALHTTLNMELVVHWAERSPVGQTPAPSPPLPGSNAPSSSTREYRPMDAQALLRDILRDHQYVIVFSLTDTYFNR